MHAKEIVLEKLVMDSKTCHNLIIFYGAYSSQEGGILYTCTRCKNTKKYQDHVLWVWLDFKFFQL